MNSWHSYPSIYNLGHRAIEDLLSVQVNVEEKIDGSQFSFGVTMDGETMVRSKGKVMEVDAPEKMFSAAVDTVRSLDPNPGWTYRCEYLQKPKHNSLAYERIPEKHLIVFDINTGEEEYLSYDDKAAEALRIGLEVVPRLFAGTPTIDDLRGLLGTDSILGGQKIEGVVIKPSDYSLFGRDKKALMGKHVSEAFKEMHSKEWKKQNPSNGDVLDLLAAEYRVPGRWNKAVAHLRESGVLEQSPRDIGALVKEVPADIEKECADEIKEKLWKWAWPHLRRKVTHGLPEWYKGELMERQF